MVPSKAQVYCKHCKRNFARLEWMTNKICDNPNCNCPEIRKSMEQATKAIDKARATSVVGRNTIKVTTTTMPTGMDENLDQYFIEIAPVTVIEVTPPKKGR